MFSGIFGLFIEPMGYVLTSSSYQWLYFPILSILLNQFGIVVDLSEKRDPNIVGIAMGF
jgi:hypothetical protein